MPPGVPMPPSGIRRSGGRTYARGGAVSGPAWAEGNRAGTQVQHTDGKMDGPNIGRGKPITYKKGGRVNRADGGSTTSSPIQKQPEPLTIDPRGPLGSSLLKAKPRGAYPGVKWTDEKATGGRIYAPEAAHTAMAPHLPGGAGGGLARLHKAHAKHGKMRI